MAATAALGACAGDELARQGIETQIEPQRGATPAPFARAPVTGPIHTAVVPRAADATPMTVVAVLGGPSVADLQEAAARKLTGAEKAAIKAQRVAEQAAPRAQIEAAGGTVISTVIFDLHTGATTSDFVANAATDSSTIRLAVLASSIGITPGNPRFSYTVSAFDLLSTDSDSFAGTARYNAFHSAVNDAQFLTLPPGNSSLFPIVIDPAELALTPARGVMVISEDNKNGPAEAMLLKLPVE